jgi:hypothetical protein
MMKRIVLAAAILLVASAATADRKRQVRYLGIHPVAKVHGGGACYIEGPHVHTYEADKIQYRDHRGHNFFVGDPVAYGFEGPKHAYKGHHPIQVHAAVGDDDPDTEFCYLDGAHYHSFAPPEGPDFKRAGDVYFYVGTPPKAYLDARPTMIQINDTYKPLVYTRPIVTVEAPAGWIGARVEIVVPAPAVRVHVHTPAVIIRDHRHYKHKKHKKWK